MAPLRPTKNARRWEVWLACLVVLLACGLLSWRVIKSGTAADNANLSTTALSKSVSDLSAILNRRAPTLEYMACRDRAQLTFEAAQAEYLRTLIEAGQASPAEEPALAKRLAAASLAYQLAQDRIAAVTNPDAPLEGEAPKGAPVRCPNLPT